MRRYVFSMLFIAIGVVLLFVKNPPKIRGTENVNLGWVFIGLGVVSLAWDYFRARREPPEPGPPEAKPPESKPPESNPPQGSIKA